MRGIFFWKKRVADTILRALRERTNDWGSQTQPPGVCCCTPALAATIRQAIVEANGYCRPVSAATASHSREQPSIAPTGHSHSWSHSSSTSTDKHNHGRELRLRRATRHAQQSHIQAPPQPSRATASSSHSRFEPQLCALFMWNTCCHEANITACIYYNTFGGFGGDEPGWHGESRCRKSDIHGPSASAGSTAGSTSTSGI